MTQKRKKDSEKLAGKTVAFVGKFGYKDWDRSKYTRFAETAGAKVVDAATDIPDCLIVGEGRGGKLPSEVAKIQKKSPGVEILDTPAFLQCVLPSPESVLAELLKGRDDNRDRYWEQLDHLCRGAQTLIDLDKTDLRKQDLYGAELESVSLNGADFRGANTNYTNFSDLEGAKFDESDAKNAYLRNLKNCTFKKADLESVWMFWGGSDTVENCDFRDAKMNEGRLEGGTLTDCKFGGANLCDAEMEGSTFERADFSAADMSRVHGAGTQFKECKFAKANLQRADLRKASLVHADLRGVNLQEAVLNDADLTGADVTGADFQDAVLTGATLNGVDFSKAKNYLPPVVHQSGPKLLEFVNASAGSKSFETSAEVDLGKDEFARLQIYVGSNYIDARSVYQRDGNEVFDRIAAPSLEQAMFNLADRWPNAKLRLDSVQAKGSKTHRGKKLLDLALAAWAETFRVTLAGPEQLKAEREEQQAAALRERDDLMARIRNEGAAVWNNIDYRIRDRYDLRGADLSHANLDKINLWGRELKGANFSGSSLKEAELWGGQLLNAVFTQANMEECRLEGSTLDGASFQSANLSRANLERAKLQGADFSTATLSDVKLDQAQFDQTTIFPAGFKAPAEMVWKGDGPRPGTKKVKIAKAGTLDFEKFLKQLGNKVERARMDKAGAMLKAERFQLFADVQDDSLMGIVKSQSDKDLVYSCRLTSAGAFGCCTQNLRPCGGLRGALCKHLLVLIVGLAKAGELDAATVDNWINLSRNQKPAIDEESMSATFLRYKGAEAGEIDWRPTETIPEDFYTM